MVTFEEDEDNLAGSGEEDQDEDENMDDAEDQEEDANMEDEGDNDEDNDENDDENDEDDDQDETESPSVSRRQSRISPSQPRNPTVTLTSPSPRPASSRSIAKAYYMPSVRPEALTALTYDIAPTMAAPQGTSINAVTATPDMRWVFSGGQDGYVRMYNWVDTANGKVPLTVAQKHPFVDSVMKAGALTTYWENEDTPLRTPPAQSADEPKDLSSVYSLAVQHQAIWLLSGCESGAINLQTCRHQAGAKIHTLREHTSAVSALQLSLDEQSLLSGSWDKRILDWDLNMGQVKRTFPGSGAQISAIEMRPLSSVPIPRIAEPQEESTTFSSNNALKSSLNGSLPNGTHSPKKNTDNNGEAAGSPGGSLFGDDDNGSLFGDNDDGGNDGGGFGDEDDEFSKAIANGLQQADDEENTAPDSSTVNQDTDQTVPERSEQDLDAIMAEMNEGGPVQPPAGDEEEEGELTNDPSETLPSDVNGEPSTTLPSSEANGLPHSSDPLPLPNGLSTTDDTPSPTSESTFLDAAIDGTLRIWDRRMALPIASIAPPRGTPPWCMGACWSPDGNTFYAGRRNGAVDEYSVHKGFRMGEPERTFRFPSGSGAVSAVRAMPNGRHLVW